MEIGLYRDKIKMLARQRDGTPVYNGSSDHAAIIVEHIFMVAHSEVRLLSGDLNSRVYGTSGVVQRAREFLGHSNHKLRVLLERETYSPSHPLIEEMRGQANVEVRVVPSAVQADLRYHLMTADNDCFRFEPEKDNHTAVAAFGDQPAATNLNNVFDSIWEQSAASPIASEMV